VTTIIEHRLTEKLQALTENNRQRLILVEEVIALQTILSKTSEEHNLPAREHKSATQACKFAPDPLPGSKRDRMETAIEQFLQDNSRSMHRTQITEHLKELGVCGQERNPLDNVSSILSASKRFIPVGNGLWAIKQPTEE
jgi:carbamoylphosphate synthase large subunit